MTQAIFESHVPGMADATDEVWRMIEPMCERALQKLSRYPDGGEMAAHKERVACLMAAREAIPHLDLAMTPQGFAVVRNENLVPASKDRVDALKESLRRSYTTALDALQVEALQHGWGLTEMGKRHIDQLVWQPTIAQDIGLRVPSERLRVVGVGSLLHEHGGGDAVYDTEFRALRPRLLAAHYALCDLISPEQMGELLDAVRNPPLMTPALQRLRYECLCYITAHFDGTPLVVHERRLLEVLRSDRAAYSAWASSSVCRAQESTRYENHTDDGTFFFG